jgi:hypothetical protein
MKTACGTVRYLAKLVYTIRGKYEYRNPKYETIKENFEARNPKLETDSNDENPNVQNHLI